MNTIYELQQRADQLKKTTDSDAISPEDDFGLQADTLEYLAGLEHDNASLGIRQVYRSTGEMQADAYPKGTNGKPLKYGQLVLIWNPDAPKQTDNGDLYIYQEPGWLSASHITDLRNLTCKGLFATEEDLNKKYPHPDDGWWAYVGNEKPYIYRGDGGAWIKTDANGPMGQDGKDGHDGSNGHDGKDGKDGTDGHDGSNGHDGKDGKDGTDGHDGSNGHDGKDGNNGRGVDRIIRFYTLATAAPAKPDSYNPDGNIWKTTEPSFVAGKILYYTDETVFDDGTFRYSDVSMSTSYIEATTAQDNIAKGLGYSNYNDMYNTAVAGGKTIISGGYINTELLETTAIVTKALASGTIVADKGVIKSLTLKDAVVTGILKMATASSGNISDANIFYIGHDPKDGNTTFSMGSEVEDVGKRVIFYSDETKVTQTLRIANTEFTYDDKGNMSVQDGKYSSIRPGETLEMVCFREDLGNGTNHALWVMTNRFSHRDFQTGDNPPGRYPICLGIVKVDSNTGEMGGIMYNGENPQDYFTFARIWRGQYTFTFTDKMKKVLSNTEGDGYWILPWGMGGNVAKATTAESDGSHFRIDISDDNSTNDGEPFCFMILSGAWFYRN